MEHFLRVLPEFSLACLVLAVLPGPATALFLHRTLRDGRRSGLAAVAGNELGVFAWALAAGAGLTTLLQANRVLFDGLHIFGGIVLAWLGVSAWRSARRDENPEQDGPPALLMPSLAGGRTPMGAFRASLVSIAANPKAAVFAFAFYPEFLPRHGPVLGVTVALATFQVLVIDGPYCTTIVIVADRVRPWLSRAAIRRRLERLLGAVLVALGVELAATTR